MYVRDARNRDEVWLLDHIEEMGLDETAFRSRDYVIAVDERTDERTGFGRIRIHKGEEDVCELTSLGVLPAWRDQGVGAHVVERLLQEAGDQDFETVYTLSGEPDYLAQFGFAAIDDDELPPALQDRLETKRESLEPEAVPMGIDIEAFSMPQRFREAFKAATADEGDDEPQETAEDFGIDPEETTYKYDTGD